MTWRPFFAYPSYYRIIMSSETTPTAENGTSKPHEENGGEDKNEGETGEDKNEGNAGDDKQEGDGDEDKDQAAKTIQRNYRGYKGRREMKGCGMSAAGRWREVLKDAQFEQLTSPKSKDSNKGKAKGKWGRLTGVAARAGADEDADENEQRPTDQFGYYLKKLRARQGQDESMAMGLEYWLEMVDQKHRYGRNLLEYHSVWRDTDTQENFFYWLDDGDGKDQDIEACPRKKLDSERIQYLSREERHNYKLEVDKDGLLRWATSEELVTTYPKDDQDSEEPETRAHLADDLHNASALIQAANLPVPPIITKIPQASVPNADWIFVVDTQFRIYAGLKEKGGFQHSSFLHGSRVLSAGRISIKDGHLLSLSPHSGHYRPTAENFWITTKCLEAAGVDMSQARVWDSYGTLKGAEMYRDAFGYVQGMWSSLYDSVGKVFGTKGAQEQEAEEKKEAEAKKEGGGIEEDGKTDGG